MSGPYCGTCVHFNPDSIQNEHAVIIGVEYGECLDPTKLIYYKRGEVRNMPNSVMSENYCSNHQGEEDG